MWTAIHVYIRDKGASAEDEISVEHVFYGETEAQADEKRLAHLAGCENFALAEVEGRVTESVEEVEQYDVPTWAMVADLDEDGEDEEGDEEKTTENISEE